MPRNETFAARNEKSPARRFPTNKYSNGGFAAALYARATLWKCTFALFIEMRQVHFSGFLLLKMKSLFCRKQRADSEDRPAAQCTQRQHDDIATRCVFESIFMIFRKSKKSKIISMEKMVNATFCNHFSQRPEEIRTAG